MICLSRAPRFESSAPRAGRCPPRGAPRPAGAEKLSTAWGTFLNEACMRKLHSPDGVRPTGRSPSVMSQSHQAKRLALRRNRRAPHARGYPLQSDGTQGTAPDILEVVAARARVRCARRKRRSEERSAPRNLALASTCCALKRPPTAKPAPATHRARALAKTPSAARARTPPKRRKESRLLPSSLGHGGEANRFRKSQKTGTALRRPVTLVPL